uniref:Uncharacterized protein n=1 Tax=Rhizophora mucronata TaxID=61149 RepID=A0A2P2NZM6_RHIMU
MRTMSTEIRPEYLNHAESKQVKNRSLGFQILSILGPDPTA